MESNMELQMEHLCKSYRKKEALQDVSFTLQRGIYGKRFSGIHGCPERHTGSKAERQDHGSP